MLRRNTTPPPQSPVLQGRTLLKPVAPSPDAQAARLFARGRRVYEACIACHLPDGKGVPGGNPPLVGPHVADAAPGRLIRILLHGVTGPVTINAETYEGLMPPADLETNDDIAAVLTYIRAAWGNKGTPVTPDMVAQTRLGTAGREDPWTIAELDALSQ